MNPRERLLAVMRGKPIDRVPIKLEKFQFQNLAEIQDPGIKEISSRIIDETTYLIGYGTGVNRHLVTPANSIRDIDKQEKDDGSVISTHQIETPKGPLTYIIGTNKISETAWTIKYPCETLEDIDKIRSVPWELPKEQLLVDKIELPEDFAQRGLVVSGISSPFVCVAGMMSYEYYLELCAAEYELIRELTQVCFDRIYASLDFVLNNYDIEYVWMGGSEWLTPPMGSPKLYEELVHNFEQPLIERMHEAGAISHVHCHGNVRSTIEMVIERGGDFFEPVEPPPDGDITMAEAKAVVNGRMTLGGNIESRIIEDGTIDEVEKAVYAAFEGGKNRMILQTTAGPICEMTPKMVKNYHKMIDIWEEMSPM